MRIDELEWDEENSLHISRHKVTPGEVEDICFGLHVAECEEGGRHILSGQTDGGRYLNVVVERIGRGVFRPVTAFEMSEGYKRRYRQRMKKGGRL